MSNVIPFPVRKRKANADFFDACPVCSRSADIFNIGRDHWAVCHPHKIKWCIGSNLFSSWREESEEDWLVNEYRLRHYRVVQPRSGGAA